MLQHENNDFFRKIVFLIPTRTVLYSGAGLPFAITQLLLKLEDTEAVAHGSMGVICTLEGEHMWACVAHSAPCVGLTN